MSDVPTDLIRDLLLRLPSDDLARFRCVCKPWRLTIDDASFSKSNLLNQLGGNNLFISNKSCGNLYSIPITSLYPGHETKTIEPKSVKNLTNVGVRLTCFPIATCDGLTLVTHPEKNWVVCNLLTRESRNLPAYHSIVKNDQKGQRGGFIGIGYDKVTDDYKVVRTSSARRNEETGNLETIIYSLKSGEWRSIDDYPNLPRMEDCEPGVFFNGAIHWVASYRQAYDQAVVSIFALDLSTEKYRQISVPLPTCSKSKYYGRYLSVLNDCLIFSCERDVWMLNDYGGEEIWTKFLSLGDFEFSFSNKLKILAYVKSIEQVLIQNKGEGFLWYHLQTGCMKKVTINGLESGFTSQVFPTSLIRFNGIKRKQTLNRSGKRLKLELTTSDQCVPPDY